MRQLISVITKHIIKQLKPGEINMVRLESFDDPIIYKSVCEQINQSGMVQHFVAKITLEKYEQFISANNSRWTSSLMYLHQGNNPVYSEKREYPYDNLSYVDFDQAITKWRNESPNMPSGATSLILLMGTDAAPDDAGSLKDTTFVISPKEIIELLSTNYGEWFRDVLLENSLEGKDYEAAIHTLYRAIFANINVNIFKLSQFVDSLHDMSFSSCQEIIDHICETLNTVWHIPSVIEAKYIPKVHNLSKKKLSSAQIVTNAIKFITRADDIPSASAIKKIEKKFQKFSEDCEIDVDAPFPEDSRLFDSYRVFEQCVIDFMRGIHLAENREKLLNVDYAIIHQIIGTKLKKVPSEKAPTVLGTPMQTYASMFLEILDRFHSEYSSYPRSFCIRVERISLSDCVDDQKEDTFRNICNFMGGILQFFNSCGLENQDDLIEFTYDNDEDPFDFSNYDSVLKKVHSTGKWGEPCKIHFIIRAQNEEHAHTYEFKWAFSPYAPWVNAFSYLNEVLFRGGDAYPLPTMVICKNIQDYLCCESEDEFYAQLNQMNEEVVDRAHCNEIHKYFEGDPVSQIFDKLCNDFRDFAVQLADHGFYTALGNLRTVVEIYTDLMDCIKSDYNQFTDVQKEKVPLLLNCFVITSNVKVLETCDIGEVIFPAYNPVMLEKIDAQQLFLRDGFTELASSKMANNTPLKKVKVKLQSLVQLSSITQGTDFIFRKASINMPCKCMWEYYGVYFDTDTTKELLCDNAFGNSIVTDDEDATALLYATPISDVVRRNIMDYIRTFPARIDGLNVAFIAPTDMQHIVAAIHSIAKELETNDTYATINLTIICLNSRKNPASYLKKWLDSYFNDDRKVKVNTYLRNITLADGTDIEIIEDLLKNCDVCFNYDILQANNILFNPTGDEIINKEQAKFPMTFTPDTIPATHGKARKVSISQFQFLASKSHTQANFVVSNPNSLEGVYRTFQNMELNDTQSKIIELSHEQCKWVVCIDPAIDRRMLETADSRIIGFTTGEGSYGELNVTVSARNDILTDIKQLLQSRIKEKFYNWDNYRLQKASEYCVDELSQYMDGSRILKALNPYDYEIHNFLAYILTIQMLGLTTPDNSYAVRSLISLDSYKHWFREDDELCKDNKRPDFMLLEIPLTEANLDPDKDLSISVKIIECKMGYENDSQLEKAQLQLEKGIQIMSFNWDPNNTSIMHRYWLNQLYRAIIFSPLNLNNTSPEYNIIRNKIYNILCGKYCIEWSGDIFAFWLDSNADDQVENEIDTDLYSELLDRGIILNSMVCHECGQMFIQRMLLPPEVRSAPLERIVIVKPDEHADDSEDEDDDNDERVDLYLPTGESIPSRAVVCMPYLTFLSDRQEHTRAESLGWFGDHFSITAEDKTLLYESNGHPKWETVLDDIITMFRKNNLIENSQLGSFYITDFGAGLSTCVGKLLQEYSFERAIAVYRDSILADQSGQNQNKLPGEEVTEEGSEDKSSETEMQNEDQNPPHVLSEARFLIGEDLKTKEKYYWEFGNKNLNNRHLLINGNSGCGKTYCIQTLLMEMVHSGVSAVVFDYTSGFTPDKLDPVFIKDLGDRVKQRVVYIEKIPVNPFAKQTIKVGGVEAPESDTFVATRLSNVFTTVYGFGGQQKSALYNAIKNGLKHHKENMNFTFLEEELNDVNAKQAETVLSKIQPFLDLEPFAENEEFNWTSVRDSGGMVYVMQLDGFDRPTQLLLTELLLWDIWNYCVKNGDEEHPFVVVLDEAQNLSHAAESPSAKFLTEGRKFGISAWYATQFMKPQLSDDEIQRLQQAGQKLYFCPPDDGVMTVAKNIDIDSQGAKEWAPKLKSLKKGECVTCGNMLRNEKWTKYEPRIIKVTSLQERINHD